MAVENISTVTETDRQAVHFGIRLKLILAFTSLACLTVAATAIAVRSDITVASSLRAIDEASLPGLTQAFVLARQSAEMSAISSRMAAAADHLALDISNHQREALVAEMQTNLQSLADRGLERPIAAKLSQGVNDLSSAMKALAQSVDARFAAAGMRQGVAVEAVVTHRKIAEALAPVVDDANFNLILGLRSAADDRDYAKVKSSLEALATSEAEALAGSNDLRAESNLLVGILTEMSLAQSTDLLRPLKDRLSASADRAKKALAKLSDLPERDKLRSLLADLIAADDPERGLSILRARELQSLAQAWQRVDQARALAESLNHVVNDFVSNARNDMTAQMLAAHGSITSARSLLAGVAFGTVLVLLGVWLFVNRNIVGRLRMLTTAVLNLSYGRTDGELRISGSDEITSIAQALECFKANARDRLRLEREAGEAREIAEAERATTAQQRAEDAKKLELAADALGRGLDRLADGDLTYRITDAFAGELEKLRSDFNRALAQIENVMSSVYNTTEVISSGAAEIASGSDDLSQRAAQQAANLEETSTSLETISATVRNSAQLAKSAHLAVEKTKAAAELSGDIVQNAIGAMTEIETSSRKINRIIGAIDEIAFQTNLLALNAGVEAARAGEAGRGFAVIAAEVRGLSQRSAKAAAEIKSLISESQSQVARGVKLVHDTNDAFISIIGQVDEVAAAMAKIALDSQLQSVGLDQISSAVNQLDQSTQKNALVAEQSLTGARSMAKTTDQLVGALKAFKIAETKDNVIGGGRASRPVALKRKISRVS